MEGDRRHRILSIESGRQVMAARDAVERLDENLRLRLLDARIGDANAHVLFLAQPVLAEVGFIAREELLDDEVVHFFPFGIPELLVALEMAERVEGLAHLVVASHHLIL
uniref:MMGP3 n=1 Tax=uncultured organism TaxID=155900 RepID=G9HQ30_9ZZZZ|nr:MMGP3 [uncultured organism]